MQVGTVLIISYYFTPSPEVGARRITALAQYLAARGVRVIVVSAFAGTQEGIIFDCQLR